MLSFIDFAKELKETIKNKVSDSCDVSVNDISKNNGVVFKAIVIRNKESNISPTIYLEDYYKAYSNGMALDAIVKDILQVNLTHSVQSFDVSSFADFNKIRDKICYRLINHDNNKELLNDIPHTPFLDLEFAYYCMVKSEEFGNGSILIRNEHLKFWGISEEELKEVAEHNTPIILPAKIRSFESILGSMLPFEDFEDEVPLFVMSNSDYYYGAGTIAYPGVIDNFSEYLNSDLVIIPSSIHETILVPYKGDKSDIDIFNQMVIDTNCDHVAKTDILSDHVYCYNKETREIYMPFNEEH